jgi:Caspase domain
MTERTWTNLTPRLAALLLVGSLYGISAGPALADKRVALVVGVSAYQHVQQLKNTTHDADIVADLFKRAGFDTIESRRDLGIADLRKAIRDFSQIAANADVAIVYYAGHGIEVDGNNYLIPADAKLSSDFDIEDETVSLDRVLRSLDQARRLKLVILDACRDNPFAQTMKRSTARRSIGRGLAKIEPAMSDTLIAFAARAGAVASDGEGQNGPFAMALVKYIAEPGLDLRIAFGRVRDEVLRNTDNSQEPFVYGSLGGDIMALVPGVAKPADPSAAARVDYELAAQVGTKEAWTSFLVVHPGGLYAELARAQSAKLQAAERSRVTAEESRAKAEDQAEQKADELRKQIDARNARQSAEDRQKLSEQAKKDIEDARRQITEQTKKDLEAAREQVRISQEHAEAARSQVETVRRQAAEEARAQIDQAKREAMQQAEKIASLTPTDKSAQAPPAVRIDPNDIARLLQAHLKRVGCDPGNIEGNWDAGSRRALDLFNTSAQTTFDIKVASLDALDAVRSKNDRVCPLVCAKGERVDGDHCISTGCSSGYFLNSSGACEKRPEAARKKPEAISRRETPAARAVGRGGKCFSFGGKTYCE